jgi:hypothetical protein
MKHILINDKFDYMKVLFENDGILDGKDLKFFIQTTSYMRSSNLMKRKMVIKFTG